jgi:hypothetical protein
MSHVGLSLILRQQRMFLWQQRRSRTKRTSKEPEAAQMEKRRGIARDCNGWLMMQVWRGTARGRRMPEVMARASSWGHVTRMTPACKSDLDWASNMVSNNRTSAMMDRRSNSNNNNNND